MEKKKIHLIGNAHLDPVWLWRWQEGFAEIKATFQSALDRMNEFPGYIFTSACASYYEWIEENEPSMFKEIQRRVKEGRWVIAGGWYIQPDCNIPSGESFARHALYSQRYFQEKFGTTAKCGYNVDSFGHNIGLPQLLKKSGMDNYVFMRPMKNEKELDNNLFRWRGADGSEVNTFRISMFYNTVPWETMEFEDKRLHDTADVADNEGINYMCFFGVGNHGGGATIETLNLIESIMDKEGKERWTYSSPNAYFEENAKDLPVYEGDLQHHAPGCYSAYSKIKADNRRAEHALTTAEKLRTTADIIFSLKYPYEKFTQAWKDVMFNQFHDIMGGCSIKEAYEDAAYAHGEAMNIAAHQSNFALQKISWNIDTTNGLDIKRDRLRDFRLWEAQSLGTPVVIYNPLSWEVTAPVVCTTEVKYVTDDNGNILPFQRKRASQTDGENDMYETIFLAAVPAFGYTVCRVFKHADAPDVCPKAEFEATDTVMENKFLKVEIDPETGGIAHLFRKDLGLDLLSASSAADIMDETPHDTWGHFVSGFHDKAGSFKCAKVRLVEHGPVRTVIRTDSTYENSTLTQMYILNSNSRRVDVDVRINWQEQHKMLKLCFPVNVDNPGVTADAAYAHIEREANGMEDPCQQWVDLHGTSSLGEAGLALLNDSKYGYDADKNVLRMTALRSPIFADHFSMQLRDDFCEHMDQGVHKFRYSVYPHGGTFADEPIVKSAYELNVPPQVVVETFHEGTLPASMTGISISADNVIAPAFKESEDGGGYILRCVETNGKAAEAEITVPVLNRTFTASFAPGEIKTFYIPKSDTRDVFVTNLLEWEEK